MTRFVAALVLAVALSACTMNMQAVREPPYSYAAATAPPWQSMVYAARTDSGVVVVDLGWYGAGRELRRTLARLGARPEDVTDVFLTHSHRDHIGAWETVRTARFHLSAAEVPIFQGDAHHRDLPSRTGEAVLGNPAPWPGELAVRPFTGDTVFTFGRDTLRAYLLPGHTPGSAAYLFRRVLFMGDAFVWHLFGGIRGADEIFTENSAQNRANVRALLHRVLPLGVDWACNAHAKCVRPDSAFVAQVTGPPLPRKTGERVHSGPG
ncbi:MAG TPA: MBL fold metallo-hydrolase [Longimicrobium sp.]|jgi:glyoxylase-like metal-dependent hydrolase (beta-lactamase superfamily II)